MIDPFIFGVGAFLVCGLWVKKNKRVVRNPLRNLISDLDVLPFIDREVYYSKYPVLRDASTKSFIFSRGCPFRCSFCFNNVYARMFKNKGGYLRFRSPESVIKEILEVKQKWGLEWVQFHDSTFNSVYKYSEKFLEEYIANKDMLPGFICNVRADNLDNHLVGLLKQAGCDKVTIGVQHGREYYRRDLLNRGGDQSDERIIRSCGLLKKNGIRVYVDFIVGLPGETVEDVFESIGFCRLLDPDGVNSYLLSPFPGTDIHRFCVEHGFTDPDVRIRDFPDDVFENKSVIVMPDIERIINLQKFFYVLVRHPEFEFLIRLLVRLSPNRLFTFIHGIPQLRRALRYDKKSLGSKLCYVGLYIRHVYQVGS